MRTFWIREGERWAGNALTRQLHVSGITCRRVMSWTIGVDMSDCPHGATVKLVGTAAVTPRIERVRNGGISQLLSMTHEESDRVIATHVKGRVRLRTYRYRNGRGPSTTGESSIDGVPVSEPLCEVDHGQPADIAVIHRENTTSVRARVNSATNAVSTARAPRTPWLRHVTFAHAVGHRQRSAPGDVRIDLH